MSSQKLEFFFNEFLGIPVNQKLLPPIQCQQESQSGEQRKRNFIQVNKQFANAGNTASRETKSVPVHRTWLAHFYANKESKCAQSGWFKQHILIGSCRASLIGQ